MSQVSYPTLNLFVYTLKEGLGDNEDIPNRSENFLANFPKPIQQLLRVAFQRESQLADTTYVELLTLAGEPEAFYSIKEWDRVNGKIVFGYYYPVQLSDTYGLLCECVIDESGAALDVGYFHALKKLLVKPLDSQTETDSQPEAIQGDLGKTWMLSGLLPANANAEEIAYDAYKAFMAKEWHLVKTSPDAEMEPIEKAQIAKDWQYRNYGQFLGAEVFEVWRTPHKWESIEENIHVLIILYQNPRQLQASAYFHEDWMRLLCYRNKIVWAYRESRDRKRELQLGFKTIRKAIQTIQYEYNLQKLQNKLRNNIEFFSDYVVSINALKVQSSTIDINLENYKQHLQYFSDTIQTSELLRLGKSDLIWFEKFSNIAKQYREQTDKDYASLSPGVDMLENAIQTIRSIVEIEQAKSDRQFQAFVQIAGVGIGTASVVASASANFVKEIKAHPPTNNIISKLPLPAQWSNLGFVLGLSIISGMLASIIAALIVAFVQPRRSRSKRDR